MKIIDILVKMVNGTLEDGFKFKWSSYTYTYNKKDGFEDEEGDTLSENKFVECSLNDEVELIEENKEIEELKITDKDRDNYNGFTINIADKANELVRAINKITKEIENR